MGCGVIGCQWHGGSEADLRRHVELVVRELRIRDGHSDVAEKHGWAVKESVGVSEIKPVPAVHVSGPALSKSENDANLAKIKAAQAAHKK